ncbi:hypothetical protein [Streptomyces sp. NPDC057363]
MLTDAACAVLSGAASITAIGEWIADPRSVFWPCSDSRPTR